MLFKLEISVNFYFHYYLFAYINKEGEKKGFPTAEHKLIGNICWMGTNNNIEIQYGSWKESVAYITSILTVFKNLNTISKQLRLQQN